MFAGLRRKKHIANGNDVVAVLFPPYARKHNSYFNYIYKPRVIIHFLHRALFYSKISL